MPEHSLTPTEIRTVETRESQEKRQYKQWLKMLDRADMFGKLETLIKCSILFNIHETDAFLQENIGWVEYCKKLSLNKMTASRYLNVARGLLKICGKATMITADKKFIFDSSKMEAEFKQLLKDDGDVTLESLARIGAASNGLRNYFFDEHAGADIHTDDALKMLLGDLHPASEEEPPVTGRAVAPYCDEFILAYAKEHGLLYDPKRGWINGDGTELSEQQRTDITTVTQAIACPENIASSLAKFCKEIEHQIQHTAESYSRGLKKDSKPIHEAIDNHFRGALVAHERLGAAIGNLHEGNIEKALWCLKSSAEEFFGTPID